jgi:hypothetical protein
MHHVDVYREDGRYAAWPANNGMWSWSQGSGSDEIVVCFVRGYMTDDFGTSLHRIHKEKKRDVVQARSIDGGETWNCIPAPMPTGEPTDCPGGIDFAHPDFALRCTGSQFLVSYDRCATWQGPYRLPTFDGLTIHARTDYQVYGPGDALVFLTAVKTNGKEGRVYCMRTTDGGASWRFVSWIGPEPDGFSIMPASVRLSDGRLFVAIRRKEGTYDVDERTFIELFASDDEGESWEFVTTPAPDCGIRSGNPPAMILLDDGRLCLTYGYRSEPQGIRARLSGDGLTWGAEIVLRDDAGDSDIGYPRTMQRSDGKIVTMYYYDDKPDGERYIGASIWDAG